MINKLTIEIIRDYESKPHIFINETPLNRNEILNLIMYLKTIPLPVEEHSFLESIYFYIKELRKK